VPSLLHRFFFSLLVLSPYKPPTMDVLVAE
jgi:hypothetical protein